MVDGDVFRMSEAANAAELAAAYVARRLGSLVTDNLLCTNSAPLYQQC